MPKHLETGSGLLHNARLVAVHGCARALHHRSCCVPRPIRLNYNDGSGEIRDHRHHLRNVSYLYNTLYQPPTVELQCQSTVDSNNTIPHPVTSPHAESQEDRLVSIPDLNAIIPEANRSELDPRRSFFGVFDGRECCVPLL